MASREPFTRKTVSNTGSISKTFVAYGILLLQQQGKLSVSDSIIAYFPDFSNREIAEKVRIIHMLTHTSGLPDSRNVDNNSEFFLTAKDEENFSPLKQTDSLEFEPGSKWNYSNPSYNGLALIIEKVSGLKWQEFIKQNLFVPAGMADSKITDGDYPSSGVAHGYRLVNEKYEEYDFGEYPTFCAAGNGGIWSSVEDLARYVEAMAECKFLACESVDFSKSIMDFPNWAGEQPATQGVCWVVRNSGNPGKSLCIEHTGSQGGFRAHLMMFPVEEITIIWLTNNNRGLSTQVLKILAAHGLIKG